VAESLILLIHGEPKAGKTHLAHTAPGPRLILDAENGSRFIRGRRVSWDPATDAPPAAGEWDTCVVQVRDFSTLAHAYTWLNSGQHAFRSVVLDSLTEIQKRCKDQLTGTDDVVTERAWGQLLVRMERLVRDFRDLTMHPTAPIEALVILALSQDKGGKWRPAIQGGLGVSLPGFVDVIGYLAAIETTGDDGTVHRTRRLLVAPHSQFEAGDRTGAFEPLRVIENPTVVGMLDTLDTYLNTPPA
jgi:hypothetical protein